MTTTRVTSSIHLAPTDRPLVHLSTVLGRPTVYVDLDGAPGNRAAVVFLGDPDQAEALSEAFASAATLLRGDTPHRGTPVAQDDADDLEHR